MLTVRELSTEVLVADQPIVNISQREIELLKERVLRSPRKRIRICAHRTSTDCLHEMFIVFTRESYIRPSKHLDKDESLHVLEGVGEYLFFDEQGNVTEVVPLGDYASGRQFYCRIPAFVNHALILRSEVMAIHEATEGPFDRAGTVYAPWSPEEDDAAGIERYVARLRAEADRFLARRA